VFAGVGERTREGNDLYHEMVESVRHPAGQAAFIRMPTPPPCPCRESSSWTTSALTPSAPLCTAK
jgi:F0F1-type ATP synthase beta subunit